MKKIISLVISLLMIFSVVAVTPCWVGAEANPVFTFPYFADDMSTTSAETVDGVLISRDSAAIMTTDGTNNVMQIGPAKTGWNTYWKPGTYIADSFKLSMKVKIAGIDATNIAENTNSVLWKMGFYNGDNTEVQTLSMKLALEEGKKFYAHSLRVDNHNSTSNEGVISKDLFDANGISKDWVLVDVIFDNDAHTMVVYADGEEIVTNTVNKNVALNIKEINLANKNVEGVTTYFDDVSIYDATYGETVVLDAVNTTLGTTYTLPATAEENGEAKNITWEKGSTVDISKIGTKTYTGKTADKAYSIDVNVGIASDRTVVAKHPMGSTAPTGLSLNPKGVPYDVTAARDGDADNKAMKVGEDKTSWAEFSLSGAITGDYRFSAWLKPEAIDGATFSEGNNPILTATLHNSKASYSRALTIYVQTIATKDAATVNDGFYAYSVKIGGQEKVVTRNANADWFLLDVDVDRSEKKVTFYIDGVEQATVNMENDTDFDYFQIQKSLLGASDGTTTKYAGAYTYVDDITISTPPAIPNKYLNALESSYSFTVGQGDSANIKIPATFTDNSETEIALTGVSFDTSKVGTKTYTAIPDGFDTPVTVTLKVCNTEFDVNGFIFNTVGGAVTDAPEADGKLVRANVKHYTNNGGTIIFAYYENGELVSADMQPLAANKKGETENIIVDLNFGRTVTDNGVIRAFVFSDTGSIKPIDMDSVYPVNGFH